MLNAVVNYFRFTTEDCSQYPNSKLPTLDCELWVDYKLKAILYNFYEKPQVSNRMLLAGTALAKAAMESSLIQEGVRRLLNTSRLVSESVRTEILNNYVQKLINSGHGNEKSSMFAVQAVTSYVHTVWRSELPTSSPSYRPLHLSKDYMKSERLLQKTLAKGTWYKQKNNQIDNWRSLLPKEWSEKKLRQRNIEGIIERSTVKQGNRIYGQISGGQWGSIKQSIATTITQRILPQDGEMFDL